MTLADPIQAPDSWLSGRDDRFRVLAMLVLALGWSALTTPLACVVALGLALALTVSLRLGARLVLRRLWPLLALLVPLALLTPFYHPISGAHPIAPAWLWGPTWEGLRVTGTITARILALALVTLGALEAAPFDRTIKALQDLRVPRALVHTALLTYRYLFLFASDLRSVRAALTARGFQPGPNLRTANTFAGVTGGLLVRSLARTERVEAAMRCRGYDPQVGLVVPTAGRLGLGDAALLCGSLLLAAGLLLLDRGLLTWPTP